MANPAGAGTTLGYAEYERLLPLMDERRFDEALVRCRVVLEKGEIGLYTRAKLHNLASYLLVEGLRRPCTEAVLQAEESVRLFSRLQRPADHCQALITLACAHQRLVEWDKAEAALQTALRLLQDHPDAVVYGDVIVRAWLGTTYYSAGRKADALHWYAEAESYCRDEETAFLRHDIWRRRALTLMDMDRPDEAARWLDQVQEAVRGVHQGLWWKHLLRCARARLEVARGNWAAARELIVNTLALAREHMDLPAMAECTCLLAQIEQGEGNPQAWRRARAALNYAIASGRRDVVQEVRERMKALIQLEEGD